MDWEVGFLAVEAFFFWVVVFVSGLAAFFLTADFGFGLAAPVFVPDAVFFGCAVLFAFVLLVVVEVLFTAFSFATGLLFDFTVLPVDLGFVEMDFLEEALLGLVTDWLPGFDLISCCSILANNSSSSIVP